MVWILSSQMAMIEGPIIILQYHKKFWKVGLSNLDLFNKIFQVADKSGISKRYIAAGSSMVVFWLLFGLLAPLTISLIAFTYPAIQSIRSLEENQNQEKWLTYWVVYGVFNIVEFFGDILLSWFPLYFFIKTAFLIWCMAPIKLNGSIIIFKMIILPFFILHKEKLGKWLA